MTFYTFMQRTYGGKNSPEGDFAKGMKQDKEKFPKNGHGKYHGWYKLIRNHLMQSNTYANLLDVFERCWEEYVRCVRSK